MKHILLITITLLLIFAFSSCVAEEDLPNPFLDQIELNKNETLDTSLHFSMITDVHLGRELRDLTEPVAPYLDNYQEYLNNENPEFILNLGDLFDEGKNDYSKFSDYISHFNDIPQVYVVGNHDGLKSLVQDTTIMNQENFYASPMESYTYTAGDKKLSIYKLETSKYINKNRVKRMYTMKQLEWLNEALASDDADYKIFIQHIPFSYQPQDDFNWYYMGYENEREMMNQIMNDHNIKLLMLGHHHDGDVVSDIADNTEEFILGSFHEMTNIDKPRGFYYDCSLDFNTGLLTIDAYRSKDKSFFKTYSFNL